MRIFIRAVKRDPSADIFTTLASLSCRDPEGFAALEHIHIISGDGNRGFLGPLCRTKRITVHTASTAEQAEVANWHPKRRGVWSYLQFLKVASKFEGDPVVMEDDVEVTNGWYGKLKDAVDFSHDKWPDRKWILSSYVSISYKSVIENAKEPVITIPPPLYFWGNLMTFWPREMMEGAQKFIEKTMAQFATNQTMGCDHTLEKHFRSMPGGKILCRVPGLVEHRGDITSLSGVTHRRRSVDYDDGFGTPPSDMGRAPGRAADPSKNMLAPRGVPAPHELCANVARDGQKKLQVILLGDNPKTVERWPGVEKELGGAFALGCLRWAKPDLFVDLREKTSTLHFDEFLAGAGWSGVQPARDAIMAGVGDIIVTTEPRVFLVVVGNGKAKHEFAWAELEGDKFKVHLGWGTQHANSKRVWVVTPWGKDLTMDYILRIK